MTNDKTRFTFRIPDELNKYIDTKRKEWLTSKTGALIRIIQEHPSLLKKQGDEIFYDDAPPQSQSQSAVGE